MTVLQLIKLPAKLEELATSRFAAWLVSQAEHADSPAFDVRGYGTARAEAALATTIQNITKYITQHLPKPFHNTLLSNTMTEFISAFCKMKYERYKCVRRTRAISRMIESFFTKSLTSLSLNNHEFIMFRYSLLSKSYLLTGITRLYLDFKPLVRSHRQVMIQHFTKDVVTLLEDLRNLTHLTVNYICTDDILKCIAKHCKSVKELDISSSANIYDDSMLILTQLHSLTSLNLDDTSVCRKGIETLLISCPNIEHIITSPVYNTTESISYVLEQIANSDRIFPKLFKITTYKSYNDSFEKLQLLVQLCPLIQNLSICLFTNNRSQCNIKAITDLKHLRELTLQRFSFYTHQVSEALLEHKSLSKLELQHVKGIDLNALLDISEVCPGLESLSLESCTFKNSSLQREKELKINFFGNLRSLTLFDSFSNSILRRVSSDILVNKNTPLSIEAGLHCIQELAIFLLSNCYKLEYVQLSNSAWLTEGLLLEVLQRNRLMYLKELKIRQYPSRYRSGSVSEPHPVTDSVIGRIMQNYDNIPSVTLEEPTETQNESAIPLELQLELLMPL